MGQVSEAWETESTIGTSLDIWTASSSDCITESEPTVDSTVTTVCLSTSNKQVLSSFACTLFNFCLALEYSLWPVNTV